MKLRVFNWEISIRHVPDKIRQNVLDNVKEYATKGLVEAEFNLKHHTYLKENHHPDATEAELKGYDNAIEQDEKSITNYQAQLSVLEQ